MLHAPIIGIIGLIVAALIYIYVKKQPNGNERMNIISDQIYEGAIVFLKREYSVLAIFVVIIFLLLAFLLKSSSVPKLGIYTAISFLAGAICSILAGWFGMTSATRANVRTSWAAKTKGQGMALRIAFFGGSVMGLSVAALGLLGVGILFMFFGKNPTTSVIINGFAMGASSIALFARVGVGYTRKPPMLALTSSENSKKTFPKTTIVTLRLSRIMSAIMSVMSQEWARIFSRAMSER
jgi:K(+)-stimulated pyrophosphate-energized sodium pump